MSAWAFLLWVLAISIAVLILGAVWFVIEAAKHGIGANLGGRAGWRFTRADVDALRAALRPAPAPSQRRRRRSA